MAHRAKTFLFVSVASVAGCVTVPPEYHQTYHDPSLPNLDLIYVGDKVWVDGFAEIYKEKPDAEKFFAVYGDITFIQELPDKEKRDESD